MKLQATSISDAWVIESDRRADERGTFSTLFAGDFFHAQGLQKRFLQTCISTNERKGTLRGMHWQEAPHGEVKVVHCIRGAIHDVILDLRPGSPTFRRWHAEVLSADSDRGLYIPVGCAHGYQTLTDDAWVLYQISAPHVPASARGVRWNDDAFGIQWPVCDARVISARDATYPDFHE